MTMESNAIGLAEQANSLDGIRKMGYTLRVFRAGFLCAGMSELVDELDSGSSGH